MKSLTTKLMIAAAALAVASTAAMAQAMKVDIPFAFRAGDQMWQPGVYRVDVKTTNGLVYLSSVATRESSAVLGQPSTPGKEWRASGIPTMAFECGAGRCSLTQLWAGAEHPAYLIPHRKLPRSEQASVTLIRLVKANGD